MTIEIEVTLTAKLAGRYKFIRRDGASLAVIEETPWFDNDITDIGLDRIAVNQYGTWCFVGANNTPTAFTDTQLYSFVAGTDDIVSTNSNRQAAPPYFGWTRRNFRFGTGIAAGTLAEVGVGWSTGILTSEYLLFSRALVKDINGNPTTITVLADEILDVVYELRLYPDLADKVFTTNITGIVYSCILRPADVDSSPYWSPTLNSPTNLGDSPRPSVYNGAIGAVTGIPSGLVAYTTSESNIAYINGSHEKQGISIYSVDVGNFVGGITAHAYSYANMGMWQMSFTPAIMKTIEETLYLRTKVAWSRA